MQVGQTFNAYGSHWMAVEVTPESNERFEWFTVVARWTFLGPAPLWPDENRRFVIGRRRRPETEI